MTGLPADLRDELRGAVRSRRVRQVDLAAAVGVTQGAISQVLTGRRVPSRTAARGLVGALGLEPVLAAQIVDFADAHSRVSRNIARRRRASP